MKMKISLIVSLFLSLATANAMNSDTNQETKFQTLVNNFTNGSIPKKASLSGWFSSRCYTRERQNFALAGLVAGKGATMENGEFIIKIMLLVLNDSYESNYFDTITLHKRDIIARTLNPILHQTNLADSVSNYLTSSINGQEVQMTQVGENYIAKKVFYRKEGDTLVEVPKMACEVKQKVM